MADGSSHNCSNNITGRSAAVDYTFCNPQLHLRLWWNPAVVIVNRGKKGGRSGSSGGGGPSSGAPLGSPLSVPSSVGIRSVSPAASSLLPPSGFEDIPLEVSVSVTNVPFSAENGCGSGVFSAGVSPTSRDALPFPGGGPSNTVKLPCLGVVHWSDVDIPALPPPPPVVKQRGRIRHSVSPAPTHAEHQRKPTGPSQRATVLRYLYHHRTPNCKLGDNTDDETALPIGGETVGDVPHAIAHTLAAFSRRGRWAVVLHNNLPTGPTGSAADSSVPPHHEKGGSLSAFPSLPPTSLENAAGPTTVSKVVSTLPRSMTMESAVGPTQVQGFEAGSSNPESPVEQQQSGAKNSGRNASRSSSPKTLSRLAKGGGLQASGESSKASPRSHDPSGVQQRTRASTLLDPITAHKNRQRRASPSLIAVRAVTSTGQSAAAAKKMKTALRSFDDAKEEDKGKPPPLCSTLEDNFGIHRSEALGTVALDQGSNLQSTADGSLLMLSNTQPQEKTGRGAHRGGPKVDLTADYRNQDPICLFVAQKEGITAAMFAIALMKAIRANTEGKGGKKKKRAGSPLGKSLKALSSAKSQSDFVADDTMLNSPIRWETDIFVFADESAIMFCCADITILRGYIAQNFDGSGSAGGAGALPGFLYATSDPSVVGLRPGFVAIEPVGPGSSSSSVGRPFSLDPSAARSSTQVFSPSTLDTLNTPSPSYALRQLHTPLPKEQDIEFAFDHRVKELRYRLRGAARSRRGSGGSAGGMSGDSLTPVAAPLSGAADQQAEHLLSVALYRVRKDKPNAIFKERAYEVEQSGQSSPLPGFPQPLLDSVLSFPAPPFEYVWEKPKDRRECRWKHVGKKK